MLLIVAHHYIYHSALFDLIDNTGFNTQNIFIAIFGAWGKTGINCFIMITGYFMCTAQITARKFIRLILQIEFYKILIYALFVLTGVEELGLRSLYRAIVPLVEVEGFVQCFLVFYLTIPFLNILIHNLSKRQHQLLLAVLFGAFSLLALNPMVYMTVNYVFWFQMIYLLSAYIRIHQLMPTWTYKQWGALALLCILLGSASCVAIIYVNTNYGFDIREHFFLFDSNQPLTVVAAVAIFLFFKDLPMPNSRLINAIAASTFGVLLIHDGSGATERFLWKETLNCASLYGTNLLYAHAILSTLAVYTACTLIDQIRLRAIEPIYMRLVDHFLNKRK